MENEITNPDIYDFSLTIEARIKGNVVLTRIRTENPEKTKIPVIISENEMNHIIVSMIKTLVNFHTSTLKNWKGENIGNST